MNTCDGFCSWSRTFFNIISAISCSIVIKSFLKLEEKPLGHKVIATLSFTDFIFHIFQIFLIWMDPDYPLSGSTIGTLTNTTVQFSIFWSSCMAYVIYQSFHRYDKNQQGPEDKYSQRRYLRLFIPCLSLVFILTTLSLRPSENQLLYKILSYGFNAFALGSISYYYIRAIYLIRKFPDMVRQTLQKTIKVLFAYLAVQLATVAPIIIRNFLLPYYPLWSLRIDYLLALLITLTGTANSQIFFWQKRSSAARKETVWTQDQNSSYVSLDSMDATL